MEKQFITDISYNTHVLAMSTVPEATQQHVVV